MDTYDLIVIGAGSAGVRCARISAGYGAKVAVVEAAKLGGTCVNLGCVPKKLFAYAAHYATDLKDAQGYGWNTQGFEQAFNWSALVIAKNTEINRLNTIYANLLEKSGARLYQGVARYLKAEKALHQVQIQKEKDVTTIAAKRVLMATGGRPSRLTCQGAEHAKVSDDLFYLDNLPKSVAMIGGGYIAAEFASIFAGLGVEVHVIIRSEKILKSFDAQLGSWLTDAFAQRGINVHKNTALDSIEKQANGSYQVKCSDATGPKTFAVDLVVAAIGREPNIPQGFEASVPNMLDNAGFINVNKRFEMPLPGLYAVGDLLNGPALTPVAIKQGHWLADHWFKPDSQQALLDIPSIPTAVFTEPALATVGATEAELAASGQAYKTYLSEFRPMKHTLAKNPLKSGLKLLVTDDPQEKVLGLHMFGNDAPEVVQGLAVAFDMGMTKSDLNRTLGIHPTTAEEWVTLR